MIEKNEQFTFQKQCRKCSHKWVTKQARDPMRCPACQSRLWDGKPSKVLKNKYGFSDMRVGEILRVEIQYDGNNDPEPFLRAVYASAQRYGSSTGKLLRIHNPDRGYAIIERVR